MRVVLLCLIMASLVAAQKKEDVTKLSTRVGYLPKFVLQHPIVTFEGEQEYFDVWKKGKQEQQIIVVYAKGVKVPKDSKRPIELRGKIRTIDLGGKAGKGSYKNEMMYVRSWRYLKKLPEK